MHARTLIKPYVSVNILYVFISVYRADIYFVHIHMLKVPGHKPT